MKSIGKSRKDEEISIRNDIKRLILDAATDEFLYRGFKNTRVKSIAVKAGINPAQIYYYLGDKEKIYRMVLNRAVTYISDNCFGWIIQQIDPMDKAPDYKIAVLLYFLTEMSYDPNIQSIFRLYMHDLADNEKFFYEVFKKNMIRYYSRIESIVKEGVSRDLFEVRDTGFFIFGIITLISAEIKIKLLLPGDSLVQYKLDSESLYSILAEYAFKVLNPGNKTSCIPDIDGKEKVKIIKFFSTSSKW